MLPFSRLWNTFNPVVFSLRMFVASFHALIVERGKEIAKEEGNFFCCQMKLNAASLVQPQQEIHHQREGRVEKDRKAFGENYVNNYEKSQPSLLDCSTYWDSGSQRPAASRYSQRLNEAKVFLHWCLDYGIVGRSSVDFIFFYRYEHEDPNFFLSFFIYEICVR